METTMTLVLGAIIGLVLGAAYILATLSYGYRQSVETIETPVIVVDEVGLPLAA